MEYFKGKPQKNKIKRYVLAFSFCKCVVNNDGFNRNSNHSIVSASNGTDVGFSGSSMSFSGLFTTNKPITFVNNFDQFMVVK